MRIVKAISAVSLFFAMAVPGLNAACNIASAAGTFGFTVTGTLYVPDPAPVGGVGIIRFDQNGNASGSQDRSVGGAFAHELLLGKLTVHSDCTLSLLANVYDTSGNLIRTSTLPGVLVNNGQEIRVMFASVVLPNGVSLPSVLTVDAVRVHTE
jgi:hypothetical protein